MDIILQAATAYSKGDRAYAAYLSDQVYSSLKRTAEFVWKTYDSYLSWRRIFIIICEILSFHHLNLNSLIFTLTVFCPNLYYGLLCYMMLTISMSG